MNEAQKHLLTYDTLGFRAVDLGFDTWNLIRLKWKKIRPGDLDLTAVTLDILETWSCEDLTLDFEASLKI